MASLSGNPNPNPNPPIGKLFRPPNPMPTGAPNPFFPSGKLETWAGACPAMPSAPPARMPSSTSSKVPRGRLLCTGERAVHDVDSRLPGDAPPPQLEVTPITEYTSDPGLVLGRQIAVNRTYTVYGFKLGNIRVLKINTALRSLLRGHTQRVTDMAFFAEDVRRLASASIDGQIYVWRIDEGPDEESKPQISGKIEIAIQIVGEAEAYHPRICWHSHKKEILFVGIGSCVLRIDTTIVGRGKDFTVEEPVKCHLEKLIDGVRLVGKHDGAVTDLSISQWMSTRLASGSKDGTVMIWDDHKQVPLSIFRPHDGQAVYSVAFLTAPERPNHINLITAGPLNREVKIWASTNEDGWLLPSDSETWKCTQTLELVSSLEPRVEEAFFNQVAVLPQASLILLVNAKKNAIYAVHVEYGPDPASTRLDYIADFTIAMPILSLTGTHESQPDGKQVVQVYCVQTMAIQQYCLELSFCLPPTADSNGFGRDPAISCAYEAPLEMAGTESSTGTSFTDSYFVSALSKPPTVDQSTEVEQKHIDDSKPDQNLGLEAVKETQIVCENMEKTQSSLEQTVETIAMNGTYIVYGLKVGNICVLNINTALGSFLRGHTENVTDLAFFPKDDHRLASASVDGRIYVWRIDEGPDEESKPQISGKIEIAIQIVGKAEAYHPRIFWHSHKQEILFVGIGSCVLRIDTTVVGRGKHFTVEEPVKCHLEKLIDGVRLVGKHDDAVTDLSIPQWMSTHLASGSKDGTSSSSSDPTSDQTGVEIPEDYLKWLDNPEFHSLILKIRADEFKHNLIKHYCYERASFLVQHQITEQNKIRRDYEDKGYRWKQSQYHDIEGVFRITTFRYQIMTFTYQKRKKRWEKHWETVKPVKLEEFRRIDGRADKVLWKFSLREDIEGMEAQAHDVSVKDNKQEEPCDTHTDEVAVMLEKLVEEEPCDKHTDEVAVMLERLEEIERMLMNCGAAELLQEIHEDMAILSEDPKIKIPETGSSCLVDQGASYAHAD